MRNKWGHKDGKGSEYTWDRGDRCSFVFNVFITHQYIGAVNHLPPIYWCCKHKENPGNVIIGAACLQFLANWWNIVSSTNMLVVTYAQK